MAARYSSIARFFSRPVPLVVLIVAGYLLIFIGLFPIVGPIIGTLAALPVMAFGWAWGVRAGLLAGLAFAGLNMLLWALLAVPGSRSVLGGLTGYLVLIVVGGVTGYLHDLNERLRLALQRRTSAEQASLAGQARLQALLEHSADGVSLIARDGTVLFTSPAAERILGASPGYWVGGQFRTRLHPDEASQIEQLWANVLAQPHARVTAAFRYQHLDGSWRWLEVTGTNWLDDPAIQAVVVNYRDVTERHQADAVLQQAERQYRTLVEQIPAILYMADLDEKGTATYNSPQIVRLGHTPDEYAADPDLWLRSVHPDDRPRVLQEMEHMRASGEGFLSEYRVLHPDGRVIWVQDEAVVIHDQAGQPLFQQGVVVDITARKQAEAALVESERRFRALTEHASDVIGLVGPDGRITYVSPAAQDVLGYTADEQIGVLRASRNHPDDLPQLEARLAELRQRPGATITVRYRTRHKDGRWLWLESRVTNLLHEPSVGALVFNFRDITEALQHERELEALVAIGAALRSATARAQMLEAVLTHVMAALGLQGATLALRDKTSDDVVNELSVGRWAHYTGTRLEPGQGTTGLVMATGQPYVSPDVQSDPRFAGRESLSGIRAMAVVALIVQQDIIGTLAAAREAEFSTGEVRLLMAMAELAASAIQRATLLETTQQGLERLTALRTIERAISNSLDLRLTLHILLEQLASLLRVDAALVLLLDAETQVLRVAASRGLSPGLAWPEVRLGEGRAGRVALERQQLEVLDLAGEAAPPGVEGFRAYIGLPLISKGDVQGVLEIYQRTPLAPTDDWRVFLEALAGQAAIAIDNAQLFTNLQDSNLQLTLAYDATLEGWSAALDLRNHDTEGHSRRATNLTLQLAQAMSLPADELVHVRRGALLHDIGKLTMPDQILLKPGPLSPEEWETMRRHPRQAYELLAHIQYLRPALDIPYAHHEKWDGSGYPRGLRGAQIPLAARIFAVADVWDVLLSDRPYRARWPLERVRDYLRTESGRHFDPDVVAVFLQLEAAGQVAPE